MDREDNPDLPHREEQDIFTSTGLLRIRIIELVDALDFICRQSGYNKKVNKPYGVYIAIAVLKENTLLYQYNTKSKVYMSKGSGQLAIGEEFLFHVSSTFNLQISFHAYPKDVANVEESKHDSIVPSVGMTNVPISRLGDGEECKVLQWYQLNSPVNAEEGLRAAVKLELLYIKDPACLPISLLTSGISSPQPHVVAAHQKRKPFDETDLTPISADTGIVLHLERNRHSKTADPTLSVADKKADDTSADVSSVAPNNNEEEEEVADEMNVLHTGLVDYCFIAGPKYLPSSLGTAATISPLAAMLSASSSTFSPGSAGGDRAVELMIWDRFPQTDYPQSPLPGKIEWFACPQGCQTIMSHSRPNPKLSTFILSAATATGVGIEHYGACLTIFIREDVAKFLQLHNYVQTPLSSAQPQPPIPSPTPTSTALLKDGKQQVWWRSSSKLNKSGKPLVRWIGVAIVMLTRWPFLRQLQAILKHHYCIHILPRISSWESDMITLGLSQSIGHHNSQSQLMPLTLWLSDIIVKLCVDLPVPIPGLFAIRLNLPGDHSYRILSQREKTMMNTVQDAILFRLKFSEALPDTHFSLDELFRTLGARNTIDVVCCALLQCKLLFHSKDLSKLPAICDCVRALLYPFHWSHVYLPVVPSPLLDLFEAPVPFMLGTHSSWIHLIPTECLLDVVIVDCDLACINLGNNQLPGFPPSVDRWLMTGTKLIMSPNQGEQDLSSPSSIFPSNLEEYIPSDVTPTHFMFQMLFYDTMVNLLRFVPHCIFFLGPSHPVFNRPLFLEKFAQPEFRPFLESLTDTNGFHQFIDSLNSPEVLMFIEGVRLVNSEDEAGSATSVLSPEPQALLTSRVSIVSPSPCLEPNERWKSNEVAFDAKSETSILSSFSRHGSKHSLTKLEESIFPSWVQEFVCKDEVGSGLSTYRLPSKGPYFNFALRNILKLRAASYASVFSSIQQRHTVQIVPNDSWRKPTRDSIWKEKILDIYTDCDQLQSDDPQYSDFNVANYQENLQNYFHSTETKLSPRLEADIRLTSEVFAPKTPKFQEGSPRLSSNNEDGKAKSSPRMGFLSTKDTFVKKQRTASVSPIASNKSGATPMSGSTPLPSSRFKKSKSIYDVDTSGKALLTSKAKSSPFNFNIPELDFSSIVAAQQNIDGSEGAKLSDSSKSQGTDSMQASVISEAIHLNHLKDSSATIAATASTSSKSSTSKSRHMNLSIDADVAYSLYSSQVSVQNDSAASSAVSKPQLPIFPVMFDEECLKVKVAGLDSWTLWKVCNVIGMDSHQAAIVYRHIITPRADDSYNFLQLQRLSPRESAARMLNTVNNIKHLPLTEEGSSLGMFFQTVITSSQKLEENELQTLMHRCSIALESMELRTSLMNILYNKSATSNRSSSPKSASSALELCQLHGAAFEALAELFTTILQICTRARDYLNAFALLEVSGRFYHVKDEYIDDDSLDDRAEQSNNTSVDITESVEMLSARVCRHPIYQSSLFWRAVMNDRVAMPISHNPPTNDFVKSVIFEVHNILHLMHNIGVNSERSVLFIQAIARDYQLDLNSFYELQRFTNSMWGVIDSSALVGASSSSKHDHFDIDGNVITRNEYPKFGASSHHSSFNNNSGNSSHTIAANGDSAIATTRSSLEGSLAVTANLMQNPDEAATSSSASLKAPSSVVPFSTVSSPVSSAVSARSNSSSSTSSPTAKSVKFNIPDESNSSLAVVLQSLTVDERDTPSPQRNLADSTASRVDNNSQMNIGMPSISLELPSDSANSTPTGRSPLTPFNEVSYTSKMFDKFSTYNPVHFQDLSGIITTALDSYDGWLVTGTAEGNIGITDMHSGKLISSQTHSSSTVDSYQGVTDVQFVRGGNCFVSACSTGIINLWSLPGRHDAIDDEDLGQPQQQQQQQQPQQPSSRFGSMMASLASFAKPSLKKKTNWTIRRKKYNIASIRGHNAPVTAMLTKALPNSSESVCSSWFIASGDSRGNVLLSTGRSSSSSGSVATGDVISQSVPTQVHLTGSVTCFALARSMASYISYSADATTAATSATATATATATAVPPMTRSSSSRLLAIPTAVSNSCSSETLDFLAVGTDQGMIEVHDISSSQTVYRILGHSAAVTGIASIRSHELITCGLDRTLKLWDLRTKNLGMFIGDRYLEEHILGPDNFRLSANGPITAISVGGSDNSLVLAASSDGIVRMWDLRADFTHPCRKLKGHQNSITSLHWNDTTDGMIQTSSLDGTMRRWDSITGRCVEELQVFQHSGIVSMKLCKSLHNHNLNSNAPETDVGLATRNWLVALGLQGAVNVFSLDRPY